MWKRTVSFIQIRQRSPDRPGVEKYELTLTAAAQVRSASFVICLSEAGSVDFDMISMMPENAVCACSAVIRRSC